MHGSTENEREQAGQISAAIDQDTGNIVILLGGRPVFGMAPKDLAAFCGGLCSLLAQHPHLQTAPEPASPLLIAGVVPPFGGRLNGHR